MAKTLLEVAELVQSWAELGSWPQGPKWPYRPKKGNQRPIMAKRAKKAQFGPKGSK